MNQRELVKVCNTASGRTPNPSSWGLYQYNDLAPAMCAGGTGSFLWFKTRERMLEFVSRYQPYLVGGADEREEMDELARSVAGIVAKLRNEKIGDKAGLKKINEVLKGWSQIEWWGTLQDLMDGKGPFPRKIRKFYRGQIGEPENSKPIPASERKAFAYRIKEYGI